MPVGMFESFVTRYWFSSKAKDVWSDQATLQQWLNVEAALALAQADLGVIPATAAADIAAMCKVELFDREQLSRDIEYAQHPLVPVLKQLEKLAGEPAAGYIHWGATTQNIFDTAAALQMRQTHAHIDATLTRVEGALAAMAVTHRDTLQAGRTHGQHALPMTFGFKVLGWLEELRRDHQRLVDRIDQAFVACMGGAIGTFAAMGGQGSAVEAAMAKRLGLLPAILPMRSSFDRPSDYVATLGLLAGTAEKIARDIVFMQRTEIGEVEEAFHMGKVGSSTMAQKRNPSTALMLVGLCQLLQPRVSLATSTMVRMDEGDSSASNISDVVVPEIGIIAASICEVLDRLIAGLDVHADRMRHNLGLTNGLIVSEAAMMQMSDQIGRHHAHDLLYDAAQRTVADGTPFLTAINEHPMLQSVSLVRPIDLDPGAYVGATGALVDDLADAKRVR